MTYRNPPTMPFGRKTSELPVIYDGVTSVLLPDGKWYTPADNKIMMLEMYIDGTWRYRFLLNDGTTLDGPSTALLTISHLDLSHTKFRTIHHFIPGGHPTTACGHLSDVDFSSMWENVTCPLCLEQKPPIRITHHSIRGQQQTTCGLNTNRDLSYSWRDVTCIGCLRARGR